MVVYYPERNNPFKCKPILLFCPPDWELTEMGLFESLNIRIIRNIVIVNKKATESSLPTGTKI